MAYEIDEAAVLFGRETARHGDWSEMKRKAAIELFDVIATLDDHQPNFVITCDEGSEDDPGAPGDPPTLHFDLGDARLRVVYSDGTFAAMSEDGTRHTPFELEFNACLRAFESTQEVAGKRRAAATVLIEAVIANLQS